MMAAPPASPPNRPALIGPWAPPQIACLRSWRRAGLHPVFLHVGDRPLRPQPLPDLHRVTDDADIAAVLRETGATGITGLDRMLSPDAVPAGVDLWQPPPPAQAVLRSRARQVEIAHLVGLDVPATFSVPGNAGAVPAARYPVVARSVDPAAMESRVLRRPDDLAALLDRLGAQAPPLLVQPLLAGRIVGVHASRSREGRVFAMEAFAADRTFRGEPVSLRHTTLPPGLLARCVAFADTWGITGPFRLAFLSTDGTFRFLGMHAGLGPAGAKAWRLGYDGPRHLLTAYDALPRGPAAPISGGRAVSRRGLLRHMAAVATGGTSALDHPRGRPLRTLAADLWDLMTGRGEVFDLHDLRGSLAAMGRRHT